MTQNNSEIFVLRTLDAAINRASEGLRVIEDHQRMVANNGFITSQLKQIRHDLVSATQILNFEKRLAARDTLNDVGNEQSQSDEYERKSTTDLLNANFSRVQQAMRSIEEFSKTVSPDLAKQIERLRFKTYALQKSSMMQFTSKDSFQEGSVYVLIDGRENFEQFCSLTQELIDAGVKLIQFRDKRLSERELVTYGRQLTDMLRDTNTLWLMNDRVDLAIASGADGVHLGQDDLAISDARRIMGVEKLIGVSTHNIEQAREAVLQGADYIGVGPVFPSNSKSFDSFPGLEFASQVASEIVLPAFAIGGIAESNLQEVMDAGIRRVAIRGSIIESQNPAAAFVRIQSLLAKDAELE